MSVAAAQTLAAGSHLARGLQDKGLEGRLCCSPQGQVGHRTQGKHTSPQTAVTTAQAPRNLAKCLS